MNSFTPEAAASTLALAGSAAKLAEAGQRLGALAVRVRARADASRLTPAALASALLVLSLRPAAAQTAGGTGSLDTFLTNVVNMVTGTTGQAIAIIAVALCGLGAMFGALSARAFGGVVLGCAMIFSAAWIVQKITGA